MDTCKVKKEKLVEEIGVYFEKEQQLSPLAARIFALLMLCSGSGHTFDELVEYTNASKSSVSTSIQLLLNKGSVEYFTKPGERKRFFRLSKTYVEINLKDYQKRIEEELKMLEKVNAFNQQYNTPKYKSHKEFGEIYKRYLQVNYENLESIIHKLNQLERTV